MEWQDRHFIEIDVIYEYLEEIIFKVVKYFFIKLKF